MNPWRAALTSATASGKSTRMASRNAIACSSAAPVTRAGAAPRGQLDRGVQRQRRELLALRLLHRLGLLLRELAQPAHQVSGSPPNGNFEATSMPAKVAAQPRVTP